MEPRIVRGIDLPERFEASGSEGWFVLFYEGTTEEITYGPYKTEQEAREVFDMVDF